MSYKGLVTALLLLFGSSFAEPYIAVRTGFKCSQCHVNGTGGGKRTDFGAIYSQYQLLMKSAMGETKPFSFDPKLNSMVSLGANFRIEGIYTQKYTTKPVNAGDSVQVAPATWNSGIFKEKNLYVDMDLVKDWIKLYYDVDMAGGAARELWARVNLPANAWLKAGQMLLPYGFRLMDDEAFVRATPQYTYSTYALAYEAGIEPGPFSFVANVTAGDKTTPGSATAVGSVVFNNMPVIRTYRIGGSYSYELAEKKRDQKGSYGVFGGLSFGMFTFLGERDYSTVDSVKKVEDYVEMDFLPARGHNLKVVYESLWPDRTIPQADNNQRRIVLGYEPFLMQFLQLGLYYRMNDWIPQSTAKNQDQIVGRVHVFF